MIEDVTPKAPDAKTAARQLLDEEPVDNGN
jgi:hypothetical protein